MQERIAIIGAGKVGTAVGHLLRKKGYNICAVACRSIEKAKEAQALTGGLATSDPVAAAQDADVIFITTQDTQIKSVCDKLAESGCLGRGDAVFHFSGALSLKTLESATKMGALTGCIHPMQSFADVYGAIKALPGSFFGVTAPPALLPLARRLVKALQGKVLIIDDKDKPIYHAAACVASNYLVSLLYVAEELYSSLSMPRDYAIAAVQPLIEGTLRNIRKMGPEQALTGPISRGDAEVIEKHLVALKAKLPQWVRVYREMAKITAEIARKRGSINQEQFQSLNRLLEEEA